MIPSRAGQAFLFSYGIAIVVGPPERISDSYLHTMYVLRDNGGVGEPTSRYENTLASYEASGSRLL